MYIFYICFLGMHTKFDKGVLEPITDSSVESLVEEKDDSKTDQ